MFLKQLTNTFLTFIMTMLFKNVPLAQLDRASGYGPEGQGFESLMVRQPSRKRWFFIAHHKVFHNFVVHASV